MKIRFSDPGMKDLTVDIPKKHRAVARELTRQAELRNYTTAQIVNDDREVLTLYRPLGSHVWQTTLPEPDER